MLILCVCVTYLLDFEVLSIVYLCSKQLIVQNIVKEEKNSGLNGLVFLGVMGTVLSIRKVCSQHLDFLHF